MHTYYKLLQHYNNYQSFSTMQKKNLETNIGVEDFNKKIFSKSIQLITTCKKIPINQVSNLHRDEDVKKKYNAIEDKLQNILKILRTFTETQKPVFNNPIDLALQILEQTKLKVDIQFRKANQEKNTVKVTKIQSKSNKQRPQQMYTDIKIYDNFQQHSHQNYLEDGIIPPLKKCQCVQKPSNMDLSAFYVDTVEKLQTAINEMKQYNQVAVDVQHSPKSYEGFTCLIQMSTRVKDYIIDVFPIWSRVSALQEIIGNPNILKVMHGAQMDTKWLQRDFNIHIVNLFDTYRAARVIGFQKHSYAFILNHYCGVNADKKYQLADWRIRPLTPQMLRYARMDTHYLLTIYDHLRIDLQAQVTTLNLNLQDVFRDIQKSSHEVTLANVELFSYKTKQLYMNLQFEFQEKKQQFRAIQSIFSQINLIAMREDEGFDQFVSRRDLLEAISFVKDIVFNRKSKISKEARIEKIATILQRSNKPQLNQAIRNIKMDLLAIFCGKQQMKQQKNISRQMGSLQISSLPQNKQTNRHRQEYQQAIPCPKFTRQQNPTIKFQQFAHSSFNTIQSIIHHRNNPKTSPNFNAGLKPRLRLAFQPINAFLSNKYGVQQRQQDDESKMDEEDGEIDEEVGEEGEQGQAEAGEQEHNGVIQFKRINPNVIYTIQQQQQDPDLKQLQDSQKPRKVKRQTEYENRIRNKKGNVFDLLGDN